MEIRDLSPKAPGISGTFAHQSGGGGAAQEQQKAPAVWVPVGGRELPQPRGGHGAALLTNTPAAFQGPHRPLNSFGALSPSK